MSTVYPREEIDAEFAKYVERGKANDWSAWADQFTEDARYVEHEYGTYEGREAIREWIVATMATVSGMSFPIEWYVVDGNRVIMYCWNVFDPLPGMTGEYKFAVVRHPRVRGQRPVVARGGRLQRQGSRARARPLPRGRGRRRPRPARRPLT